MSDDSRQLRLSRRSVIASIGAASAGLAGVSTVSASGDGSDAPEIEWRSSYDAGDLEWLDIRAFDRSDDGYAVGGATAILTRTEGENERLAVVKLDGRGDQEWIAQGKTGFAPDNDAETTTDFVPTGITHTTDGGFVVVGWATYWHNVDAPKDGAVPVAMKASGDGTVAWTARRSYFDEDAIPTDGEEESLPGAIFDCVAPATDGGALVGGSTPEGPRLVRYERDGTVAWERTLGVGSTYQSLDRLPDGGYYALLDHGDRHEAVYFDADGTVRRGVDLPTDTDETPYNHRFARDPDGGYAYTGRDQGRENMVLGALDGDGNRRWRREFDGPYEGHDWGYAVGVTADGGYAVGGYMSEAYTGDSVPAVVKTDSDGTELWRGLYTAAGGREVESLEGTPDGGIVFLTDGGRLVKLAAPDAGAPQVDGTTTTDLDADGYYEDVDGDGDGDLFDALTYYNERDSETIQNNPDSFDFDGDGDSGDLFDALALYNDVR